MSEFITPRLGRFCYVAALVTTVAWGSQVIAPVPVAAQQIDAAGAEALEMDVEGVLDFLLQGAPNLQRKFAGDLEALPDGDGYTVLIPELILESERDFMGTLPAFEARVTPLPNGWQEAIFQLTAPFLATNPKGDETVTLDFESDVNTLVIAREFASVLNGDVGFSNITATVEGQGVVARVDRLEATTQTDQVGDNPNLFDNVGGWLMEGLSADAGDDGQVSLGSFELSGDTDRIRLDLFKMLSEQLQGIDPDDEAATLSALGDLLSETSDEKWVGGFDLTMAFEDLSVQSDEGSGDLGLYEISVAAAGLDEEIADLGIAMAIGGVTSPSIPLQLAPVVPNIARLDISALDLPLQAFMTLIYDQIGTGTVEMGPKGRRMGTGTDFSRLEDLDPAELLPILMQSDASLDIDEFFVDMPIGYIDAQGGVEPDPAAVFQLTADLDIAISGLPEMIAFMQQVGGDAADAAAFGAMLGAMGQDSIDDEGQDVKLFNLEITAAGQILLNGNDMSAMMGMFQ